MAPTLDQNTTNCEGVFDFTADDAIYDDHFPGRPVVPGSLIVHAFISASMAGEGEIKAIEVNKFRFIHFIAPGRYRYCVSRLVSADTTFKCELFDTSKLVATGKMVLCN